MARSFTLFLSVLALCLVACSDHMTVFGRVITPDGDGVAFLEIDGTNSDELVHVTTDAFGYFSISIRRTAWAQNELPFIRTDEVDSHGLVIAHMPMDQGGSFSLGDVELWDWSVELVTNAQDTTASWTPPPDSGVEYTVWLFELNELITTTEPSVTVDTRIVHDTGTAFNMVGRAPPTADGVGWAWISPTATIFADVVPISRNATCTLDSAEPRYERACPYTDGSSELTFAEDIFGKFGNEVIIDLQQVRPISTVTVAGLQVDNSDSTVNVRLSEDGVSYIDIDVARAPDASGFASYAVDLASPISARYVAVRATSDIVILGEIGVFARPR